MRCNNDILSSVTCPSLRSQFRTRTAWRTRTSSSEYTTNGHQHYSGLFPYINIHTYVRVYIYCVPRGSAVIVATFVTVLLSSSSSYCCWMVGRLFGIVAALARRSVIIDRELSVLSKEFELLATNLRAQRPPAANYTKQNNKCRTCFRHPLSLFLYGSASPFTPKIRVCHELNFGSRTIRYVLIRFIYLFILLTVYTIHYRYNLDFYFSIGNSFVLCYCIFVGSALWEAFTFVRITRGFNRDIPFMCACMLPFGRPCMYCLCACAYAEMFGKETISSEVENQNARVTPLLSTCGS